MAWFSWWLVFWLGKPKLGNWQQKYKKEFWPVQNHVEGLPKSSCGLAVLPTFTNMDWYNVFLSHLSPVLVNLIIAAGIGLIIGLEREFNTHDKPTHVGGIRTFVLVAMLGNMANWMGKQISLSVLITILAGFILLVLGTYYAQIQKGKIGFTSPLALLLTFILGMASAEDLKQEALAVVVVMTTVLSLKEQFHGFIKQITEDELFAFIKFFVLSLLILPLLPVEPFGPDQLLVPRELGFIAILVLSISFLGYLLLKFSSPRKGILLTAIMGGLFSSTLIAWVFSAKSKERADLAPIYGSGIVLASSIMFIRVFVWVFAFSVSLAQTLAFPLTLMFLASMIPVWQVYKAHPKANTDTALEPGNPLDIKNALFFVLLYSGITLLMAGSRQWLNPAMTYLSGAVAGIADIDAITISTAKWAAQPVGNPHEATVIILLAVISNSLFKWAVSIAKGPVEMRRSVSIGFGAVVLAGVATLIFRSL